MKFSLRELVLLVLLIGSFVGIIVQQQVYKKQRLQCERDYMRDTDQGIYVRDVDTWKLVGSKPVPSWVEHDADGDALPTWVKHFESR
jgi:hypothetical protein